jgi:hypothetical protein
VKLGQDRNAGDSRSLGAGFAVLLDVDVVVGLHRVHGVVGEFDAVQSLVGVLIKVGGVERT